MHPTGSITALATPFLASGEIDFPAWQRLLDQQIASGIQGIVVAGSTGEAAALSDDEFTGLIRAAVVHVAGRMFILAGTGQSNTHKTIAQTRLARDAGAALALVVTPPYVRPTPAGLVAHYQAVADQGGLPVVLYNVPGRTGCDMTPEVVAQLRDHPNIVGLKEARGDEARWDALYPLGSAAFSLLSGDDPTFVRAMRGGAVGVISVASNVVPRAFSRMCNLASAGRGDEAAAINARLTALYDFLGVESNPIPLKAAMQRQGIGTGLRLPLTTLSASHAAVADAMTVLCQELEASLA